MYYSACIPALFGSMPIREALAAVAQAGLKHYEFWGWSPEQIDAYAAAQSEFGLQAVAMCTTCHDLTLPQGRDRYLAGLAETIPMCKRLGCPTVITQVGPEQAHLTREEQRESIIAGLKAAAPMMEEAGLTLVFEPLNTRVDHVGYYLWSSREAFAIADAVGSDSVKVLLDLYHQAVMEDLDVGEIVKNIHKIGHFHIAGCPGRHEPTVSDTVDYPALLQTVAATGCPLGVGLEYMPLLPPEESLRRVLGQLPQLA